MGKAKFSPDRNRPDLRRIFVDRAEPVARFRAALADIPRDHARLLVFHGVGGQGKSHLCGELRRLLDGEDMPRHLHHAHLNLHLKRGTGERSPARFLLWLRNALAQGTRMSFPAFDIAFALYWRDAFPDTPLPRRKEWSFLFRRGAEVADVGSEAGGALTDHALNGLIEGVPFVGMSLRRLIRWGLPVARERYHRLTNDALAHAYDGDRPLPAPELLERLPYFLARDLAVFLEDRHVDTRFVFLIDEYESILARGGAGAPVGDESLDGIVREFVAHCPAGLFVFFSRERLRWDREDPAWAADLAGAQVPLRGLADADADEMLTRAGVAEADLRAAMRDGARAPDPETGEERVYPFMLELQAGRYHAIREAGERAPAAADFRIDAPDFDSRRAELLRRFTRDYDPSFSATLRRLAVGRSFDRDVFARLVTAFNIHFPLDEFANLCALSFVDDAGGGRFVFHNVIREALAAMLDGPDRAATRRELFAHYAGLAGAAGEAREDRVPDLAEALYHRLALGGEAADLVAWWRDAAAPYRDAHLHPALEPLERDVLARVLAAADPATLATAHLGLARNLAGQGRYRDAALAFNQALQAANIGPPLDTATRVAIFTGLGGALTHLTHWRAADRMFTMAEDILTAAPETDPALLAATLGAHATMLRTAGRPDAAEPRLRRALEIQDRALPADDPRRGETASCLAAVLDAGDAREEAGRWHDAALAILDTEPGSRDLRLGRACDNLGLHLSALGRFSDAVVRHHRARQIYEAVLPPGHPDIAAVLFNLAEALRRRDGDGNPALPDLLARAVRIREESLGLLRFDTLQARAALVEVLRAQDRKEEAQAYEAVFRGLAERALAEGRSTPGPSLRDAFARRSRPAARRAPPTDDLDADDLAAIRATAPAPESVLYNDELSDENGGREEDDDTGTGGKPGT